MFNYSVLVYNSQFGQQTITITAENRAQAMNIAWGQGFTVLGCNYFDHD